ncbi:aldehyde dehydrogenase family protein [Paracoccus sp. N5]|uniref:aldehyde dehydrogenase family protein n=1 Tax=Paracoccus sp. N5 TaxID=1101189 RepID=UPI0003641FA0|nr:aldehyde dehydrogenase family protein [Paracoccus sp. N5]
MRPNEPRPAEAPKEPIRLEQPIDGRMLIDGELVESAGGGWLESSNPATEGYIGRVPDGNAADIDRAVAAAEKAQLAWAALSVEQRAACLNGFGDAILARSDELLAAEVSDSGNPAAFMLGDIRASVARLRYLAGLGNELQGATIPVDPGKLHLTLREPYGVVGRITAFNHPIAMAVHGLAGPLITGNTVVLKPSEQCPLSSAILGEIARDALPPGVLNIVSGGRAAGDALVRHPRVKRLSFVGSVGTGLAIQRAAAESAVKHISLELGGKNPFIVFPDAPIDKVAAAAVTGMNFSWQGQSCSSTSRLFLHEDIHDAVLARIVEIVEAIKVGDPCDWDTRMGAIVSKAQLERVEGFIRSAQDEGARLVAGGERPRGPGFDKGYWMRPTVFANVTQDMRIAREEIFGPVLSVLRWSDFDQVIEMANSVEYGLSGAVWTGDLSNALRTVKALKSGYLWVNDVASHPRAVPFGGFKNSGIGRERGLSELASFTEEKSVGIVI